MRNAGGYLLGVYCDSGRKVESDSFTCGHCNSAKWVKPKERPEDLGGFCRMCSKFTCPRCHAIGTCIPFEKKLEEMERRDRLISALG